MSDTNRPPNGAQTRRRFLKTSAAGVVGALGVASGSGTAAASSPNWQGNSWGERDGDMGSYKVSGTDVWNAVDVNEFIEYVGYFNSPDGIRHKFLLTLVGSTHEEEKSGPYSYSGRHPVAANFQQDATRITIENEDNDDDFDYQFSGNNTYPGFLDTTTSPTWGDVVLEDDDSIDTYESEIEQELSDEEGVSPVVVDTMAAIGSAGIGAVAGGGVGLAASLAYTWFRTGSQDECGEEILSKGRRWDWCEGQASIAAHHVDVDIVVPEGNGTQRVTFKQADLIREDYLLDEYGLDNEQQWTVDVPGDESSAELVSDGRERVYYDG